MTSASLLFYGRRTRSTRTTSDSDDLGFLSSSDRIHLNCYPSHRHRSSSRKAVTNTTCGRSDRRHLHLRTEHHHRLNRHVPPGDFEEPGRSPGYPRQPCSEGIAPDSGPIRQLEGVTEAPFQNFAHGHTLNSIRGRFNSNERLPRSVLLARERLLQRLRGVSVSSVRESDESHSGTHFDNHWLNDSGNWPISNSGEHLAEASFRAHPTSPTQRQLHETILKPLPLDREVLASLRHEVFTGVTDESPKFCGADECSICLERFEKEDKLIGLQCGHRFHSYCLSPWLQTCSKCPYCRSELSSH